MKKKKNLKNYKELLMKKLLNVKMNLLKNIMQNLKKLKMKKMNLKIN